MMKAIERLYIHFPFCRHLCNYCDFYKMKLGKNEDFKDFHGLLENQIERLKALHDEKNFSFKEFKSLYFGGGTPSLWGKTGVLFFESFFHSHFSFEKDYEWTMEIDPKTITLDELKSWEKLGVNRFSVGLQAFNDRWLKVLDRVHQKKDAEELLSWLEGKNFSVDFIIGLPFSDGERDIKAELIEVMKFSPKHVSVYILGTRNHYIHQDSLPPDDWIEREYNQVQEVLSQYKFSQYEVSNYSQAGFESKHNFAYWRGESISALGPSGTGYLNLGKSGFRYKWKVTTADFVSEELNMDQVELETVYTSLRSSIGLDLSLEKYKNFPTQDWVKRGLAKADDSVLRLTSSGRLVLDGLMGELFSKNLL